MKLSRFKPIYLASGGVVILSTILFYLLLLDPAWPVFGLSLSFVLLAEVILFLIAAYSTMSIVRAALISISIFHLALTILLSFLYFHITYDTKSFILWNIMLLAVVYLLDTFLMYRFRKINAYDDKVYQARSVVQRCVALAETLVQRYAGSPYLSRLKHIHEELRFSDNTALTGLEDRLYDLLDQTQQLLDNDEEDQVSQHIERIQQLLNERTQQLKQIKSGRF